MKHPESSVVDALEHAILEELKGHPDTYSRTSFVKLDRRPLAKICAGNEAVKTEPVVVDASPELVQLARTKLDQQKEKAKLVKSQKAAKQRAHVKRNNGVLPEAVRAVMASSVSRGIQAIHLHQPDGSRSKLVASQSVRRPTINMTKWEREGLLRTALEAAVEAEVVDPTECPFESGAMVTPVEYADAVGHSIAHTSTLTWHDRRVEVSPHHLSNIPTALLHDLVFLGACVTQKPISFDDHQRWYVFLTDPDRVTEYAAARISAQHAWRTFVYSMYRRSRVEVQRVAHRMEDLAPGSGDGSALSVGAAPLVSGVHSATRPSPSPR